MFLRRDLYFSAACFLSALALRLLLAWKSGYFASFSVTEMMSIAANIRFNGDYANPYLGVTGPTAHSTPPFPLALAALLTVFGHGAIGKAAVVLSGCLASALRCALLPLFAVDAGLGPRAAVFAGLAGVLYVGALQTEVSGALDGPWVALALLTVVWMSLRLWRSGSWQTQTPWLFFAVCGGAVLLNPQLIPVVAGLVAVGFVACGVAHRRRYAMQAVALSGVVFAMLLPWGVRNQRVLGAWILTRSNLGLELWVSNGPGRTYDLPENYGKFHPSSIAAEARRVADLGEVEYNAERQSQALAWMGDNPGEFARLTWLRFLRWWFPPGNLALAALKAVLTILAFAGLGMLWRNHRLTAVLFGVTWLTFPLIYYVIQWTSRMRYPMDWQLLVAAAVAVAAVWPAPGEKVKSLQ